MLTLKGKPGGLVVETGNRRIELPVAGGVAKVATELEILPVRVVAGTHPERHQCDGRERKQDQ